MCAKAIVKILDMFSFICVCVCVCVCVYKESPPLCAYTGLNLGGIGGERSL